MKRPTQEQVMALVAEGFAYDASNSGEKTLDQRDAVKRDLTDFHSSLAEIAQSEGTCAVETALRAIAAALSLGGSIGPERDKLAIAVADMRQVQAAKRERHAQGGKIGAKSRLEKRLWLPRADELGADYRAKNPDLYQDGLVEWVIEALGESAPEKTALIRHWKKMNYPWRKRKKGAN